MTRLTRAEVERLLGPVPEWTLGPVNVVSEVEDDGFVRRHVTYEVPSGTASVFVCIPTGSDGPFPLVYCHHQHAGQFSLGKSEVVGLAGAPDQAYAAELARRGFVTIAADSIGFEDRNWADGANLGWFELSRRLVHGRTLLADELHEIRLAIDYGLSLPETITGPVGFIGHSFGGRIALWAPVLDPRIRASVSNCGCISYRLSEASDAGFQADTVVPGIAVDHDVEDLIETARTSSFLVLAGDDDKWSRGADELKTMARARGLTNLTVHVRPGGHTFPESDRQTAYRFLEEHVRRAQP